MFFTFSFAIFYVLVMICDARGFLYIHVYANKITANEPRHDRNQQSECAPSEDSGQPGHPPSPFRVFAVHMKKPWALSYPVSAQRRLWSDYPGAKADLSLHWAHTHFVGFVMSQLKCYARFSKSCFVKMTVRTQNESELAKTNKMTCAPSKDTN